MFKLEKYELYKWNYTGDKIDCLLLNLELTFKFKRVILATPEFVGEDLLSCRAQILETESVASKVRLSIKEQSTFASCIKLNFIDIKVGSLKWRSESIKS